MAAQKSESALLKKVWNIANVMSSAGVGFTDYITQFTYILFIKMDAEREGLGLGSSLPDGCKWADLKKENGEDLITTYDDILKTLATQKGLIGTIFTRADNKITMPVHLKKIIDMVDEENWYMMDSDLKGAIYEGILEKNGQDSKSGAGQYFTPRALIKAIVEVVNPKITETVGDPCCGTGGFLLAAYAHMRTQSKDAEKQKFLKNHALFGADNTPLVVTLASMNLYLHDIGIKESPVIYQDSLLDTSERMFDVIMTNPPFGTRPQGSGVVSATRTDFIETSDNQVNFLQHIMSIVRTGGRVGVVLPDSVLTDSGSTKQVRDELLKEFNLHTILRLPTGIFYANGVKTNVLFFDKGKPTKDIWVYDYRTGVKHTMAQKPMTRADLDEFVQCYCSGHMEDRTETYSAENPNGRWRRFSAEEVAGRDDLNFKWIDFTEEDDRTADELVEELQSASIVIADLISQVKTVLSSTSPVNQLDSPHKETSIGKKADEIKQLIESLKAKLITAGIQGRLTEQLDSDGTAEELYQQIQAEKQRLIKEGKIKKEKPLPEIKPEEVPFEIPGNWKWVRFGFLYSFTNGTASRGSQTGTEHPVLRLADIVADKINTSNVRKIVLTDTEFSSHQLKMGDLILIRVNGSKERVGRCFLYSGKNEMSYCDHLFCASRKTELIYDRYITRVFNSDIIREQILPVIKTTAGQNTISQGNLSSIMIPLPPLAEQKRIAEMLERVLGVLN